ncbi:TRAP transporter large permease [Bauldia litoralis]|uniref:TRAP transporter large permease protein n=1 Tax=Bauldia litoralis TaxID=665467 RepID=A0A1G6AEX7_9HYPH|nr:TRAP transporter large permease [Bauldia litoralis]SDB06932.1 TRAP transporter, DctM subunit [Bauldia litoralis]
MGGPFGPVILLGSLLVMLLLGVPVAYALGIAALLAALWSGIPLEAIFLKVSDGVDEFTLLAIPFFVFAGVLMAEGGMARRLVAFANIFVGFMRGGLAMVNILASMFFGGISGSAVADTSSIGSIMIPMMRKQGYPDHFSVNITITSSTQGIIIPPSHNAIIYAFATGGTVSIIQLFLAGIIPGIMIGLALMVLAYIVAKKNNYPKGEAVTMRQALRITWEALAGLLTVVIIVGGVVGGVFTPTESAAVAVVWAFFVTMFIYRDLEWGALPAVLAASVRTVAMVMIVIGFAASFGYMLTLMQVPAKVTQLLLSMSDNKYALLLMINVMLLVLGTFMDMAPLILICTPILLPVIKAIGVDPVHFGIVMMLNLGIGLVTPPVGTVLFVGCAIGKIPIEKASRHLWPFWIAMLVVLMLVTYFPVFSLWIPSLKYPGISF